MQQQACIKCGDAKCDLYETPVNCPDDCLQNVTDCSQLPNIDAVIGTSDPNDIVLRFNWRKEIRDGPKIFLQRSDKCVGVECDFAEEPIEPLRNATNESEGRIEIQSTKDIEFFRIISKIKIGAGTCQPKCLSSCGLLQVQGWCDECEGKLLKGADCSNIEPGVTGNAASQPPGINPPGAQCCFISTINQGWYDTACSKATSGNLIIFDIKCHLGAQLCEQASDIMVKHTQHFIKPSNSQLTSINWFVNDLGIASSSDVIRIDNGSGLIFDYVAEWNPGAQVQTGSALGNLECLFGFLKGGKNCAPESIIVTGPFDMINNMPYFVSAKATHALTYADSIPKHVMFELTRDRIDYIVLPVDTKLKKALNICNALGLDDETGTVGTWDPTTQRLINDNTPSRCGIIRDDPESILNFNLQPGTVYKIAGGKSKTQWIQE